MVLVNDQFAIAAWKADLRFIYFFDLFLIFLPVRWAGKAKERKRLASRAEMGKCGRNKQERY
jgi:hypothetical protein